MKRDSPSRAAAVALFLAVCCAVPLTAAAVPSVHALTNARLVLGPGRVIDSGTVVIRDGIIEAAGADIQAPADARVWELDGLTVYPGLIESHWTRPWPEEDDGEPTPGGHPNDRVRPERDMIRNVGDSEAIEELRKAGFTTALAAPESGIFRGRSALLNLGDGPLSENLLASGVAHHVGVEGAGFRGPYPGSLMGATALFRQVMLDSRWFETAHAAYESNPAQERPAANSAWRTLAPAAAGDELVIIDSGDVLGTLRAAGLIAELGLRAYLVGNGEEYKWLEEVAATGLPHILPLTFPEVPEVGDTDDLAVSLEDLRHWDDAPRNPAQLLEAGIQVAFTARGLDGPGKLHPAIGKALERGLTADQALAALTLTPAQLLGIADRAGSLDAGKMANLTVTKGDLFAEKPDIREVWIDGVRYAFNAEEEDEKDGEKSSATEATR